MITSLAGKSKARRHRPRLSIFIGFATRDHHLVHVLKARLSELGVDPVLAIEHLAPGGRLDDKVKRLIRCANIVLVLLTRQSVKSRWVQQEIGYAIAKSKPIIPMKAKTVTAPAMLEGIEYLPLTVSKPEPDFARLSRYLSKFADENGFPLAADNVEVDDRDFALVHLPEAHACPSCGNTDVHVWICLWCGEWVCVACGGTVPVSATVH